MAIIENKKSYLLGEKVSFLYKQSPALYLIQGVSVLVLLVGFYHVLPSVWLGAWSAAVLVSLLVSWLGTQCYFRKHILGQSAQQWLKLFILIYLPCIFLWVVGSFFIGQLDLLFHRMFFLLVLVVIVISGVLTLSPIKQVAHFFLVVTVFPLVVQFAYWGVKSSYYLELDVAIVLCIYAVVIREVAARYHHLLEELFSIKFQLRDITYIDSLTTVANRRKFDIYLKEQWQQSQRRCSPLSLIILDVDHFKPYNDHYGHQAGDQCLQKVARALARTLKRQVDLLARYGGEEFAVILPGTPLQGATKVAENLRKAICALHLRHDYSDVSRYVSVSIGAASCVPTKECKLKKLIQTADQALYLAKEKGRNQVRHDDY